MQTVGGEGGAYGGMHHVQTVGGGGGRAAAAIPGPGLMPGMGGGLLLPRGRPLMAPPLHAPRAMIPGPAPPPGGGPLLPPPPPQFMTGVGMGAQVHLTLNPEP